MKIITNEEKNEILLIKIESKQLYAILLEEINSTYDFWRNTNGTK